MGQLLVLWRRFWTWFKKLFAAEPSLPPVKPATPFEEWAVSAKDIVGYEPVFWTDPPPSPKKKKRKKPKKKS